MGGGAGGAGSPPFGLAPCLWFEFSGWLSGELPTGSIRDGVKSAMLPQLPWPELGALVGSDFGNHCISNLLVRRFVAALLNLLTQGGHAVAPNVWDLGELRL